MDDGDGRDFVINVCAPVPDAGCGETVGESVEGEDPGKMNSEKGVNKCI